jgi:hypothetical protein
MLQKFFRLAVYVPISATSNFADSDITLIDEVQALLRIFREHDFAGSVGAYNAVAEISRGAETFVPGEASSPTHGKIGLPSSVVSARLVTYVPISTPREELDTLIDEIVFAHPWEHPVIEVDKVSLWIPS